MPTVEATTRRLSDVVGADAGGPHGRWTEWEGHTPESYRLFVDLILAMLRPDPAERITPFQAISHSFFGSTESAEVQTEGGAALPAAGQPVASASSSSGHQAPCQGAG